MYLKSGIHHDGFNAGMSSMLEVVSASIGRPIFILIKEPDNLINRENFNKRNAAVTLNLPYVKFYIYIQSLFSLSFI